MGRQGASEKPSDRRETRPPLLRWLGVVLRGVHLATVIALGATVLGAPLDGRHQAIAVLVTGIAMVALDLRAKPHLFAEWAGIALIAKLAVVGWMAADAALRPLLYWLIVGWSVLFAHAPASFRHRVWWHGRR
ncbi:hypothetical protein [Cognatazoarcus halotolerans]|uniref:hypothetical protein n=1 Tax=Cognatazoarcus halotolerans TaxID=2686016 RepID=UPI00135897CC|nr:hypothetical protein [Cognatazoarcus halotolerans]MCP5310363.1 hypothetical protein [Zoogloeaceae bacterium]